MTWRCDICNQKEDQDGQCECGRRAEAVERSQELESELAKLRKEIKDLIPHIENRFVRNQLQRIIQEK